MKILKEAFITKTSIDDIVEMAEKHPVAIERLKKIRDQKKEGYFEDLVKDIYPNGVALENLFDLLETDADMVEDELGIKFESLTENQLKETAYGKDELWNQINNTEYAYNALSRKVKGCMEKGLPKEYIIAAVRREIYSMKDDFGRLPTTQAERQELAQDFVEDELQGYSFEADPSVPSYRARGKWVKESLSEGFKIGSQDIQSVKVYNPYNYTIQELRINNRDKTFERGTFTMGKADKKTHNRQEYEDVVDELLSKGYKEIPSDWKSLRNKTRKGIPQREELTEANLTKAQRHNRSLDRIFDTKKRQNRAMMQFLRNNTDMGEDDIQRAYEDDRLDLVLREKGLHDQFFDNSLTEANTQDVERQLERAKSAGDDTQAWDLAMCIENDEDIYNRFITPAIKNLQRKNKRGIFDRTLAVQLFYYVVENSLKYGPRWFPYKLKDVTVPTRYLAADELVDFYEDEFKEKE